MRVVIHLQIQGEALLLQVREYSVSLTTRCKKGMCCDGVGWSCFSPVMGRVVL